STFHNGSLDCEPFDGWKQGTPDSPILDRSAKLLPSTGKICCLIRAAAPFVRGDLRIRTQRPGPVNPAIGCVRRKNLIRRLAVLDPLLECADDIERVRSFSAA